VAITYMQQALWTVKAEKLSRERQFPLRRISYLNGIVKLIKNSLSPLMVLTSRTLYRWVNTISGNMMTPIRSPNLKATSSFSTIINNNSTFLILSHTRIAIKRFSASSQRIFQLLERKMLNSSLTKDRS
jgi:hypothetical protein